MASPTRTSDDLPGGRPLIIVPTLWAAGRKPGELLTEEERALLSAIASVVRFRKGETIYRQGDPPIAVFNIITGVVKSYTSLPNGKEHIVGFLFQNDLFGLAENGEYVNSAQAVTAVTLYRLPVRALEARMKRHPHLDFQIIAKLCHDLRQAQRHALLMTKHRAAARMGLFLEMIESHHGAVEPSSGEIHLPMTHTDIASYVGMSPEAVSRSFRDLAACGAIAIRDRRHIRIIDRALLEAVIADANRRKRP
jgi:CRP-like cAMP-binding protein